MFLAQMCNWIITREVGKNVRRGDPLKKSDIKFNGPFYVLFELRMFWIGEYWVLDGTQAKVLLLQTRFCLQITFSPTCQNFIYTHILVSSASLSTLVSPCIMYKYLVKSVNVYIWLAPINIAQKDKKSYHVALVKFNNHMIQ